jgi:hypothetical protein
MGFVGWKHTPFFFEGFEDGEGAGEIIESPIIDTEVALQVGAVGFDLSETFGNGERFLEVGLGLFVLAEMAGEIAEFVIGDRKVALQVGAVGFG